MRAETVAPFDVPLGAGFRDCAATTGCSIPPPLGIKKIAGAIHANNTKSRFPQGVRRGAGAKDRKSVLL